MEFLRYAISKTAEFEELAHAFERRQTPIMASGLSRVHKAAIIDTLPVGRSRRAFVVVASEGEAAKLQEDLQSLGQNAVIYPSRDLSFRAMDGISREFEHQRVGVLTSMLDDSVGLIIAPVDAIMTNTVPKNILQKAVRNLEVSQEIEIEDIVKTLVLGGYSKVGLVEGVGQFSVRGGIVDVFITSYKNPVRIEFWSDEIDSIHEFDLLTQRRLNALDSIQISPAKEVLFESQELVQKLSDFASRISSKNEKAKQLILQDIDLIKNNIVPSSIDKYLPINYEQTSILDYLEEDDAVFIYEPSKVAQSVNFFNSNFNEDLKILFEEGILCKGLEGYTLLPSAFYKKSQQAKTVLLETFSAVKTELSPKALVHFKLLTIPSFSGLVKDLAAEISVFLKQNYLVIVLVSSKRVAHSLGDELKSYDINASFHEEMPKKIISGVVLMEGSLPSGAQFPDQKIAIFAPSKTSSKKKKTKHFTHKGAALGSLEELHRGDAVVHAIYGIGIFDGINKIENNGITKDYIKIKFKKDDVLYVPVTQLDLVTRFIGSNDGENIKLSSLGSAQWAKTKAKVKAAVKDMANELIALYSKRMNQQGFAFSKDTEMQKDFEYHFPYEETSDQLRSAEEIKEDMEKPTPMDRLLCGDVGFGKTEVALRAAFKCIAEGKQVALLVPTTILAWQHYNGILRRMEHFAVNSEMLSRFRSPRQSTIIKRELKRGNIDIVVGTHRLISNDIAFKDLGLLIIDEEQRFGVAQKEKLKQAFPNVDVLTLSATPIPRTLNMAMSGIRDMSLIEEAPSDRQPVQTYVLEHDQGIVLDAIRKEVSRGGQVYYIYNRVETINRVALNLKQNLPDFNIDVAHGQMNEEELSDKWRMLIDGEIDVLVCTTIIETGVDVPNANTLIIEDSDRFGLAQLHQLRGRVGRSARRAYAYLMYRPGKALSEVATKRLEAIREYTEFGSGFKIAMRDLEIRGAGNILGASQHGHMDSVGYDMYLKLLSDAIKEQKGEAVIEQVDCVVDLPIQAHIPQRYIESTPARLQIYRRIAQVQNQEDAMDVIDELIDRFGDPPKAVSGLIDVALLRNKAASLQVSEIKGVNNQLIIYFANFDFEKISVLLRESKNTIKVGNGKRPNIVIKTNGKAQLDVLREFLEGFEKIYKPENN